MKWTLFLLAISMWVGCVIDLPGGDRAEVAAPVETSRDASWRRTAQGWQQIAWPRREVAPTPLDWPGEVHPLTLTALQVSLIGLAIAGLPGAGEKM